LTLSHLKKFNLRRLKMIRFLLIGMVFILSTLNATTVLYQSFDDLVQNADGVISGTVSEIQYRKKKNDIYTYVTLTEIVVHDGGVYSDKEFTFRMLGGTIGDRTLSVVGSPKFSLDEKVILFISQNGKRIVPIVGWEQGVFKVKINELNNENFITDSNDNQVYDIDNKGKIHKIHNKKSELHLIDANNGKYIENHTKTTLKSNKAMKKDAFITKLKERVQKKKYKNKKIKSIIIDDDLIPDRKRSNMPTTFSNSKQEIKNTELEVDQLPKNLKEDSNEI